MSIRVKSPDQSLIKIDGLITPSNWDDGGNVTALALSTFDEDEYVIEKGRKGDQLYSFIRKKVEVRGIVKEIDGIKRIKIKDYRII